MTIRTIRTSLLGGVTAALLTTTLAPTATAGPAADVRPGAATQPAAEPRTRLTFVVDDCEGCRIQLISTRGWYDVPEDIHVWSSRARLVRSGTVTFDVATRRTSGMSVNVRTPWEGQTGYVTTVAWRYNGTSVGDPITLEEAVAKKKASGCWEGTRRRELTVPLVVEEVEVDGVHQRVPGNIAYAPTTQSWLRPMREVWDGVLGSQDVNLCR